MAIPRLEKATPNVSFERERGVYAIQVTHDVAHAIIDIGDDSLRTSRILQVFRTLNDADVPVFLVKMHRSAVTLALAGKDKEAAEASLKRAGFAITLRRDLAVVAVRAASMRDLSGIMIAIADALYESGARLFETGDSHNSVVCLIEGSHVTEAVNRLCQTFQLDASTVQVGSIEAEDTA